MVAMNASQHGLAARTMFYQQDFAADLTAHGQFDLILSNPPYIPSADIEMLDADVRHFDPLAALDGGADGLALLARLMPTDRDIAVQMRGRPLLEIGAGQGKAVGMLGRASGLRLLDPLPICLVMNAVCNFKKKYESGVYFT